MTRGRASRACGVVIALVAMTGGQGTRLAHGQPPREASSARGDEEGRRHYRRGEDLLDAGDYWGAARAFESGFAASGRFGFLLNIGNCYRRLGELGKARHSYWRFLELAPKTHGSREEVIGFLRTIEQIESDNVPLDEPEHVDEMEPASVPAGRFPRSPALDLQVQAPSRPRGGEGTRSGRWWVWALVGSAVAGTAAALVVARGGSEGATCAASLGCARE